MIRLNRQKHFETKNARAEHFEEGFTYDKLNSLKDFFEAQSQDFEDDGQVFDYDGILLGRVSLEHCYYDGITLYISYYDMRPLEVLIAENKENQWVEAGEALGETRWLEYGQRHAACADCGDCYICGMCYCEVQEWEASLESRN